jgi:hypothetical protein
MKIISLGRRTSYPQCYSVSLNNPIVFLGLIPHSIHQEQSERKLNIHFELMQLASYHFNNSDYRAAEGVDV